MPSIEVINAANWIVDNERVFVTGEGDKLLHFLSRPYARDARTVIIVKETGEYNCSCQHYSMWQPKGFNEICRCALAVYKYLERLDGNGAELQTTQTGT